MQSKSVNVQDAANELINMLVDIEEEEEEEEEDYDDAELDRRKLIEKKNARLSYFIEKSSNIKQIF